MTFQDAKNLLKLCKHFPVRVNIIEYNKVEGLDFVKAGKTRSMNLQNTCATMAL